MKVTEFLRLSFILVAKPILARSVPLSSPCQVGEEIEFVGLCVALDNKLCSWTSQFSASHGHVLLHVEYEM